MAFDFPASPSVGTVFAPTGGPVWQFNGQGWAQTMPSMIGSLIRFRAFGASGSFTYTPDPQMLCCVIECVGGGGGGGGVIGVASASTTGSGGGGGAYARSIRTKAQVGASQAVTVGVGGTPGPASASGGGLGGDTSVGTLCLAKGGAGGSYAQSGVAVGGGGTGGASSGSIGDVTISGDDGGGAMGQTGAIFYFCGWGGSSGMGGGSPSPGLAAGGRTGQAYGAGGSGGQTLDATSRIGGPGQIGVVYITEYCSSPATGDDVIGGMITIASTAPTSPAVNDVWIDTT